MSFMVYNDVIYRNVYGIKLVNSLWRKFWNNSKFCDDGYIFMVYLVN